MAHEDEDTDNLGTNIGGVVVHSSDGGPTAVLTPNTQGRIMETCRLCCRSAELQESHIIPAFVYRWQKRTSSTGYLRFGRQMNRRVQDGVKLTLLCQECERRLNVWETQFAKNFFAPFHEDSQTTFGYDGWLAKFCVSISWRVLSYMQEVFPETRFDARHGTDAQKAMSAWGDFLLGNRYDLDCFEQHLVPLGEIAEADGCLPANFQRYLMRTVEMDRLWGNESAFTFAKLGRVVLIGFICEPEARLWKNTKVDTANGILAPYQLGVPDWLPRDLIDRANRLAKLQSQITPTQHAIIDRTQATDPQRAMQSETFRALMADYRLRGELPVRDDTSKEG